MIVLGGGPNPGPSFVASDRKTRIDVERSSQTAALNASIGREAV